MKTPSRFSLFLSVYLGIVFAMVVNKAWAKDSNAQDLAKAAQNPVTDMITLPLQNNTNLGVGPGDDVQNVLNIQPVVPLKLSENWNLITRTIVPLIYQPELTTGYGSEFGLGDINMSLFLSPAKPGKIIWGVGPVFSLPTATDKVLGA